MSTSPESDFSLELHFLPAWAKEAPQPNRYAKFEGERERPDRSDDRRGPRRDGPPRRPGMGGGMGGGGGMGRPSGQGGAPRRDGPRPSGPGRDGGRPPRRDDRGPRDGRRDSRDQNRPMVQPTPLPEINLAFIPEEHGVDSLARQIRTTGRAYPLFEIAAMILAKPERHTVTFSVRTKPDKTPVQPLFVCALDDTLWLSEDDAVRHVLDRHFGTFYQPERTQVDPPKGVYTFVAQCGVSGVILGPPNYHDYQNQLRRLHQERFSRLPFEEFKARVRIVKEEEVVKKWIEDQSWKTEFTCLNLPEPLKLPNKEEVEKHFREVHLANIIKQTESHRMSGVASRNLRDRNLSRLVRENWEHQQRFPIQIATALSQQFASRGLQFFKVNRTVTHVAVARPHFLDLEASPVSEGVRIIVEFINAHSKCTHKQLLNALAPAPTVLVVPPPPVVADAAAAAEGTPAPAPTPAPAEPSPELAVVMTNLHWLIHQGHVIEFANGVLETAKRPLPKPEKPKAKAPAETPAPTTATGETPAVEAEAAAPVAEVGEIAAVETSAPVVAEAPVEPAADLAPKLDANPS